jgi:hypothetical protein
MIPSRPLDLLLERGYSLLLIGRPEERRYVAQRRRMVLQAGRARSS